MKLYQKLLLTLLSALFLFLSFKELGFFAWFALLPFLFALYKSTFRHSLFCSIILGIGFFIGLTYWITGLFVKYIWPVIFLFASIYLIVTGILIHFILNKISQKYLRIFLIPAVWISVEFLRSQTFLAFTIGTLGYSQHNFLPLMHITRFTGIYGVSFILILFNVTVFETIIFYLNNKKLNFRFLAVSLSILLLFVTYGIISVNSNLDRVIKNKNFTEIKIAAVQPNISFGDKYSDKGVEIIPEPYSGLEYFQPGTELVIFPESVIWGKLDNNTDFKDWAGSTAQTENFHLILGQYYHNESKTEWYNSAVLYNPKLEITGIYHEIHPIPFIQYMPYPRILSFLKFLDFSKINLILGDDYSPLEIPGKGKLGINICFESTLPDIARRFRNNDAEAIIVLSDDSSLNDSIAPWHHLIFSRIRAIENGCYFVHSTNTGITAIISPDGDIVKKIDLTKKGVICGNIYLIPYKTFYARFGNLILYIYLGILFTITMIYIFLKRLKQ